VKSADAYGDLVRLERPIIETREAATRLGLSVSRTSHLLRSLEESGLVQRLRHGLWAIGSDVEPVSLAPYLTVPFPAYVSFWSALARHGMIEQIPRQIYVASLHRTRTVKTTIGTYSIHQIVPELFDGYAGSERAGYLATAEKSLFDTIYLRSTRGARIYLPELVLPNDFDGTKLDEWTARIARPRLRTLVTRGLEHAIAHASTEVEAEGMLTPGG
jgi:predicted transcriptional regulator of viral defense system